MFSLKGMNVTLGIDGNEWIIIRRKKTDVRSAIPLLPQALAEYKEKLLDSLLPMYSNQKFNSYLQEIADACHIRKVLTSYAGRRTFATILALANGVSLETISKILAGGAEAANITIGTHQAPTGNGECN